MGRKPEAGMNKRTVCPNRRDHEASLLGALEPAVEREFQRHLKTCSACVSVREEIQEQIAREDKLVAAVRAMKGTSQSARMRAINRVRRAIGEGQFPRHEVKE